MSIENLLIKKLSRVNTISRSQRSRSNRQSNRNFSEVLKKASDKISSDKMDFNIHEKENPFLGKLGKA